MSKRCELTGTGVMSGHNVSHSHRKTKRKFLPNLQTTSFRSDALNVNVTLKITAATLRTVNKYGNIDAFLINYGFDKLTEEAQVLRNKVKKALIKKGEYDNVKIIKERKIKKPKTKKELKAEKEKKEEAPKKKVEAKEKKGE
jgi:large subunit ribosomal protein L28